MNRLIVMHIINYWSVYCLPANTEHTRPFGLVPSAHNILTHWILYECGTLNRMLPYVRTLAWWLLLPILNETNYCSNAGDEWHSTEMSILMCLFANSFSANLNWGTYTCWVFCCLASQLCMNIWYLVTPLAQKELKYIFRYFERYIGTALTSWKW